MVKREFVISATGVGAYLDHEILCAQVYMVPTALRIYALDDQIC
jgi:hypothetical protein